MQLGRHRRVTGKGLIFTYHTGLFKGITLGIELTSAKLLQTCFDFVQILNYTTLNGFQQGDSSFHLL